MQNSHCLLVLVIKWGTLLWCSTHEQGMPGRLGVRYWERHLAGTKGVRGCSRGSQTGAGSPCGGGGRPNVAEIGSTWTLLPRNSLRWALKVHCPCLIVAWRLFDENISSWSWNRYELDCATQNGLQKKTVMLGRKNCESESSFRCSF